ncbi:MAG: DUF1080 domain-containing protein [Gemmatimonadota bacterium]
MLRSSWLIPLAGAAALACASEPRAAATPDTAGASAATADVAAPNTLSAAEVQEGWRLLFDGTTTAGWRGYKQDTMPAGWEAVDGAFTRASRARDIITTEQFEDFELTLEWKTVEGGNSGVFFRVIEGEGPIYHYAPEIQVLDDGGHPDGRSQLTSAGANYGLHPAPRGVVRPVGQWNTIRLLVEGPRVRHWLNGQLMADYEIGSEDWQRRVAESKFAAWPDYGLAPRGHIGLQEHGSWVAFRNIKLRELP